MLDLANEVAKLQGRLFLFTFRQKFHSPLVLNTKHNGVVHRSVASTCSCEHARAHYIMHIMPIHISGICEVSFIRKKHMTQK